MDEKHTAKSNEILKFIVAFKKAHDGNSPTYREIMAGCELASTSLVAYYLEDLEARGLIQRPDRRGNVRVIEVVGGEWIGPKVNERDVDYIDGFVLETESLIVTYELDEMIISQPSPYIDGGGEVIVSPEELTSLCKKWLKIQEKENG